jgi:hypothetical protein
VDERHLRPILETAQRKGCEKQFWAELEVEFVTACGETQVLVTLNVDGL